jgi:hypothetical protein
MNMRGSSNKPEKHLTAMIAVASLLALLAGPAGASQEDLPAAYLSLQSYQLDPEHAATQHARALIESERGVSDLEPVKRYRARKFKVLNYRTQVKVLKEEVFVRMKSPGGGKSILMVELTF